MKKILSLLILSTVFIGGTLQVNAAEYREGGNLLQPSKTENLQEEKQLNYRFMGFSEFKKVLKLPSGEYIQGKMVVKTGSTEVVLDSSSSPEAMTLEEAKKSFNEEDVPPQQALLRGEIPTFTLRQLEYGAIVNGAFSSGIGWHSIPYVYQSITGGPYTRFGTFGDSARVGTGQQAVQTFLGNLQGTELSANAYQYFSGINTIYTYYPDNFHYAQTYQVANI
ncbi:hypothetical protein [Enterococcus sp. DIV0086]|uniref:hypothetical protein n=1 Tax=Enterococcus sp. DIV0086 TaxID=2774655 RepID=UPI003D2E77C9